MNFPGFGTLDPKPYLIPRGGLDVILQLVTSAISLGIAIGILMAFFFLLIGGMKWIMAGGDKQALARAKTTVTYAIIGLVLLFASFAIISFIGTLFNINLGA